MKSAGRLFFLLTFALLQCVSPLAHAHIGGDASGGAFHVFHFHDVRHVHAQAPRASSSGHRFHASNLPVVKVPDGKRRNQAAVPQLAQAMSEAGIILPRQLAETAKFPDTVSKHIPSPPPYFTQYAQAPPART